MGANIDAVSARRLFILHTVVFLAFLLGFVPTILREDPPNVVAALTLFGVVVFAFQLLLLYLAYRILKRSGSVIARNAILLLFAVSATLNATVLYYGYAPSFLALTSAMRLAALGAGCAIFYLLYDRVLQSRQFFHLGIGMAMAVFLSIVAPALTASPPSALAKADHLENWSKVRFSQRPNVHLISFDSMIPVSLADKLLGVRELAYANVMERAGSRIIPNTFVAKQGSWRVLNSVVTLDDSDNFRDDEYLNGVRAGPLFEVFKANGYKTAAGYAGIYFGRHGQYLDRYDYIPGLNTYRISLCKFQARLAFNLQLGHFGFCELVRLFDQSYVTGTLIWPAFVEDMIADPGGDEPWLTLHYIYNPVGHTEADHRTGDETQTNAYRKAFVDGVNRAGDIVASMIERIRTTDPQAIIYVFGDHGTWLSRTISFGDDPAFFVQDRYGVFAALAQTDNQCSDPDLSGYANDYNTVGRTIASIIRCLADKPREVDSLVNFVDDHDFSEFLYEPAR